MSDINILYPIARTGATDAPYLLVGEAPNVATMRMPRLWLRPDDSGARHAANWLLAYTGRTVGEYLRTFDRTNLMTCPRFTGRAAATTCRDRLEQWAGRRLILLGQRVAYAFAALDGRRAEDLPLFEWRRFAGAYHRQLVLKSQTWARYPSSAAFMEPFEVAVVPHPSGRNRWWDKEANRARARAFFDSLDWVE